LCGRVFARRNLPELQRQSLRCHGPDRSGSTLFQEWAHMPRPATNEADWNNGDRAPEYSPSAGAKVSTDAHPATAPANEARAGVTGHGVNIVLAVSLVGVIVAFVIVYAAFFA